MYALEKAVQEKGIHIESVYVGIEENAFGGIQNTDRFVITLKYPRNGSKLTTDFYMGLGNRKHNKPVPPKVEDVLYSLLLDASALELTFDDWCNELGYDTDSLKAKNIFDKCNESGKKLKKLLGKDFDYFMENNEY